MKLNTLDLDGCVFAGADVKLRRVLTVISRCRDVCRVEFRVSPSLNGFHVRFWCFKDCDLCRLVFDDQARFCFDLKRPVWLRDVLWDFKVYKKGGVVFRLAAGDWLAAPI